MDSKEFLDALNLVTEDAKDIVERILGIQIDIESKNH